MFYLIVGVHFFLCLLLVGLVLLQQGKGADMGPAFGSGGANSLFGAAGAAPFIVKLTTAVCILFMATSILLIKNYDKYAASRVSVGDALEGSVLGGAPAAESAAPVEATAPEAAAPEVSGPDASTEGAPAAAVPPAASEPEPVSAAPAPVSAEPSKK